MPNLDGIEAAKRILEERPIPIVMLTAYGQAELVQRAAEAGVFGYLVKPFRENDLVPAITTARARFEELQNVREEADSLAEALAARKVVERAKGLLMEREKLSEQAAYERLRKASQLAGQADPRRRRGADRNARSVALMEFQLRMYRVKPGLMDEWLEAFETGALPRPPLVRVLRPRAVDRPGGGPLRLDRRPRGLRGRRQGATTTRPSVRR